MPFLVTGGCGFIGSHLVAMLQDRGHHVRVLDDMSSGSGANIRPATEVIVASVNDEQAVARAMGGVDGCFHLAAIASVDRSNVDWCHTHRVNLSGTINIFQAAHSASPREPVPVVYASSAAVYGDNPALPLCETDEPSPTSAYGADKRGCELHARVAMKVHGVPCVGLRFFNVYGPRQDPTSPYSGVISKFASALYRRVPLDLHGDGEQTRDFVYVEDVARFLIAAMDRARLIAPDVLNVCSGRATSIRHLAETMAMVLGTSANVRYHPPRAGDIRASEGSPLKALRALGQRTEIDLREGLNRTLAWIAEKNALLEESASAAPSES
jgi:UDP-glucose 4-epimerase